MNDQAGIGIQLPSKKDNHIMDNFSAGFLLAARVTAKRTQLILLNDIQCLQPRSEPPLECRRHVTVLTQEAFRRRADKKNTISDIK